MSQTRVYQSLEHVERLGPAAHCLSTDSAIDSVCLPFYNHVQLYYICTAVALEYLNLGTVRAAPDVQMQPVQTKFSSNSTSTSKVPTSTTKI